jgi:small basic protein
MHWHILGVGILKCHLYDIDRLISRTLSYALVTGLLVGVYAGLVLLATEVFGFHSTVAVAASTLAVAALFNPVRRRVQRAVDRRFNRARYDAEAIVAAFAAYLKRRRRPR